LNNGILTIYMIDTYRSGPVVNPVNEVTSSS